MFEWRVYHPDTGKLGEVYAENESQAVEAAQDEFELTDDQTDDLTVVQVD